MSVSFFLRASCNKDFRPTSVLGAFLCCFLCVDGGFGEDLDD